MFVPVPGLGSLSTGCLATCDFQCLGGHTNRSLDTELGLFGSVDEVTAHWVGEGGGGGGGMNTDWEMKNEESGIREKRKKEWKHGQKRKTKQGDYRRKNFR